jgi:hypothetical protein
VASLKDPKNKQDFERHANALTKITGGKWTYGWSSEDNNKTIIVGAWKSLDVCFRNCDINTYAKPPLSEGPSKARSASWCPPIPAPVGCASGY